MKKFNTLFALLSIYFSALSQAPTITSFSPASGPVGTLVHILGTNLSSPTAFTIGGVSAILISGSSDSIVGMVMPGAATGSVSVTTAGGSAAGSSNFIITPTNHPSIQLGNKLVGTGAVGAALQGRGVAISGDGNTAIVGAPDDNTEAGAAWIYTWRGNSWVQQGDKLVGTGAVGIPQQGWSVALSADGNTAIVGGPSLGGTGAVWIYTRTDSTWAQQGSKLVGTGSVGTGNSGAVHQGVSVSLSADGNTAIAGGPSDNNDTGAAWIYIRSDTTWTQQGSKLVGTGSGAAGQGEAVALSADGNTAIVGGSNDTGAVWIYTRTGGAWTQQGSKLVGTGAVGAAAQGWSVALSADGNTAIVGGIDDSFDLVGAAWVYTRSGSIWTQQGSKLVGTGAIGRQGYSVALSADGNTAIVGGTGADTTGATWVYTRSGSVWTQQGSKLVGTGSVGSDQGVSVSLSAGGNTAIVGGAFDNNQTGAAWVFVSTPCFPDSSSFTHAMCQGDTFAFGNMSLTSSGIYIDTLTNVSGCDSIVTLTLTVNPLPVVSLSWDSLVLEGDIVAIGNGLDTISCQYSPRIYLMRGGSPLGGIYSGSTIQNDSMNLNLFNFANPQDPIFYTYTDSNGCTNSVVRYLDVGICVNGVAEINTSSTIHLYPDPNRGSFTLQTSNSIGSDYTICDMLGHVIMQSSIKSDSETIELPDAAEGVYTLAVKGRQPIRFVIVR